MTVLLTLLLASCGGGGGDGGGCTPSSTVSLSYKDSRIPDAQTSYASTHEWFASLEALRFNPVHGAVCGAATSYRLVRGSLPAGVTLDPASGVIAGTPASSGNFTPVIGLKVDGFAGEATTQMDFVADDFSAGYGDTIQAHVGVSVGTITPVLNEGNWNDSAGTMFNSNGRRGSLLPAGATTVYTIKSGSLPPGLVLDASTGVISGTPTAAGTYSAQLRLVASQGGASLPASSDVGASFWVLP